MDHRFNDAAEKINLAAVAILRAELNIPHQVACKTNRLLRLLEHLLGRHTQLFLHVQRAGGNEGVNACPVGSLEGLRRTRNVAVIGARERANGGILDRVGDQLHRLEIAIGAGRKTGFDHIHTQALQLACNAQLLVARHGCTGRLLAVAQRGIENDQFVSHVVSPGSWWVGGPQRNLWHPKKKARCYCRRACVEKVCARALLSPPVGG